MAKNETLTSEKIKFPARLAFARLDKPKAFQQGQDPRFEATFLIDPSSAGGIETIKLLLKTASDLSKQKWGKVPYEIKKLASIFVPGAKPLDPKVDKEDDIKVAFYDGDKKEYDGFAGMFVVPSHNKIRPALASRKGEAVEPGDEQFPFSGSYVRGSVTLWVQDNDYGKRVNVNLRGVQFERKGEAFGVQAVAAEDEFEALEDSGDAGTFDDDLSF